MAIFLQVTVLALFISSVVAFLDNHGNNHHTNTHQNGEGHVPTCDPNPCQNGGVCNLISHGHNHEHCHPECDCVNGFVGEFCEFVDNQAIAQSQPPSPATTTFQPTTTMPTTTTTTTTTTQRQTTTTQTTPIPPTTTTQPPTTTAAVLLHSVICGKFSTVTELANQVTMHHADAKQCASGNHTSPEAFTLSNCNLSVPAFWKKGLNVMQNCQTVPKYSPIAVFGATGYVSSPQTISGVFLGCTTQPDSIKIAVQKCDSFPDIQTLTVGGTSDLNAFHVVMY